MRRCSVSLSIACRITGKFNKLPMMGRLRSTLITTGRKSPNKFNIPKPSKTNPTMTHFIKTKVMPNRKLTLAVLLVFLLKNLIVFAAPKINGSPAKNNKLPIAIKAVSSNSKIPRKKNKLPNRVSDTPTFCESVNASIFKKLKIKDPLF